MLEKTKNVYMNKIQFGPSPAARSACLCATALGMLYFIHATAAQATITRSRRLGRRRVPSLKLIKRLKKIEQLPTTKQKALLQTIDSLFKGAGF